jgi:DNA-binding response OmpR family regulator
MKKQKEKSLVEITKLKSDFYTNITHEFKTPISIIIGLAEKLKKTIGESKSAHNLIDLDIIGRQSENLLFLVNEILTVSKIQTRNSIHWVNGNIVSHLRYLHSCYVDFAETKKITYLFHSSTDEIIMDYSREQIRVIVNNLLTNAIKHCTAGNKILLMVREDKKQKKCIIEVADNGEGITAKDLPHIFKTFYQGESDLREQMGVGIGLAFTKQLVEGLNGTIKARSIPLKETVFTVELPIRNEYRTLEYNPTEEISFLPAGNVNVEELDKENPNNPLILIAEDNRDMSFYLVSMLRNDFNLIVSHDGKDALSIATEKIPDLIISDLMMPETNGKQFCSQVKSSVVTNHIPFIMLTANTLHSERIETINAGADAFLTKPFFEEELKAKINQLLKNRKELREKYGQVVLDSQNTSPELTNDSNFEFLQKVTDLIYREMKNVDFFPQGLASEMCVSPSQLNRKIKSISGLNATNYVLKVRLNRAKKLLTTFQKPIGEIAMDCGFNDFAYFSRTFKKEFGITPSKFQRMPHLQN